PASPTTRGDPSTTAPPASHCWYRGAPREPGAHWTEPGCRSCSCQGGRVLCEAVSCPLSCSHPLPAPAGGCCPSCAGCLHEGVVRAEGDVFSPSDGNCTVCVCLAGNISCISPECPPGSCPGSSPTNCCSCQPGEAKCGSWMWGRTGTGAGGLGSGGGERARDGTHSRLHQYMDAPERAGDGLGVPVSPPRVCPPGCSVDDNGVEFPVGQIWSPGDPCELCICQADGSVSCQRTDCVETCPYPIRIPGQCCPDCSAGCTYMGRIFYNNETFPSVLDPCLSCICLVR
ncbi:VWCE protein, partial [Bucorvus abyssinicus]|nr:VWCE protein [Bucorvus abyssinicus]